MYYLQSRWKIINNKVRYYGLRNKDNMFHNTIKLTTKQLRIIQSLPKNLTEEEKSIVFPKLSGIVVTEDQKKHVPTSLSQAKFCTTCVANDYMIPGMEFDEEGHCPMCQTKELAEKLKSIVPTVTDIPHNSKSRFDVAVFYTGGKDSTYLLYYLSKVKELRVLALTWEIPYMSKCACLSIENAKKKMHNVEFITRKVIDSDLKVFYKYLFDYSENTCACPSLAYALFYPEMVDNKIKYFVAGNEPVQILGLYYNHMAPKLAYSFSSNKFLNFMLNISRVLTLHPPYRKGQFHTLMTMKQLGFGTKKITKLSGYQNELLVHIEEALKRVPGINKPLRRAIRRSSWTGNIPSFINIDLNDACGGVYDWRTIRKTIEDECGWVGPDDTQKGLHTSCKIEKCKEYSQFQRFYHMRSTMIPFSALELSLASQHKNLSKEDAIHEMNETMGFSLTEVPECKIMREYLDENQ